MEKGRESGNTTGDNMWVWRIHENSGSDKRCIFFDISVAGGDPGSANRCPSNVAE